MKNVGKIKLKENGKFGVFKGSEEIAELRPGSFLRLYFIGAKRKVLGFDTLIDYNKKTGYIAVDFPGLNLDGMNCCLFRR